MSLRSPFVQSLIGDVIKRAQKWRRFPKQQLPIDVPQNDGFPKIWSMYNVSSSGAPLLSPGVDQFDMTRVARIAKRDLCQYQLAPFTNTAASSIRGPGIVAATKALAPWIKFQWYVQGIQTFQNLSTQGVSAWGDNWYLAAFVGGVQSGGLGPPDRRIRGVNGFYIPYGNPLTCYADFSSGGGPAAVVEIIHRFDVGADGWHWDFFNNVADWMAGGSTINYAEHGYASLAAMQASMEAYLVYLAQHGDGFQTCNRFLSGAADATVAQLSGGELVEDWDPDLGNGGSQIPGGGNDGTGGSQNYGGMTWAQIWAKCIAQQGATPTSTGRMLFKAEDQGAHDTPAWFRSQRYITAAACMVGGYSYIGNNGTATDTDFLRWADEYWVNSSGASDSTASDPKNRGWLGRPKEFAYQDASGIWVRHFDKGVVLMNPPVPFTTKVISLERPYKRILGTYDPTLNNGAAAQNSISIPPKDGLFLILP